MLFQVTFTCKQVCYFAMAKFREFFVNFLFVYVNFHFVTSAFSNIDSNSSVIITTEELIYESTSSPEEIETVYDKRKPPLDPQLTLYLETEDVSFDESQMICNITLRIDFEWRDTRLPKAFEYLGISQTKKVYKDDQRIRENIRNHTQKIWTPIFEVGSTFSSEFIHFRDNKKGQYAFVTVNPKEIAGAVLMSTTWRGAARSRNDFRYFPRDVHLFRFHFHTANVAERLSLNATISDFHYHNEGEKPHQVFSRREAVKKEIGRIGLFIDILFTRNIGYHLIQTFVPSGLLTGVSLMSLFLPVEVAGDRVSLCVGILIALTVFSNEARKTGPVVSYITAMDVWLLGCISIETLILIENIVILKITTRRVIPRSFPVMSAIAKVVRSTSGHSLRRSDPDVQEALTRGNEEQEQKIIRMGIKLASRIDHVCIIISFGLVLSCNIAYWLSLHFHEIDMVNELKFKCDLCDKAKEMEAKGATWP